MSTRRIRLSKRRHEASRFIRQQSDLIHKYADITARIDTQTTSIAQDGTGIISMPSRSAFERITPRSEPCGIVFWDGSFLIFKEEFRYDYADSEAAEPEIHLLEYSYHYQNPTERFFFRFDFHPSIGEPITHPLYHLHARGWQEYAEELPAVPRFPSVTMTLEKVLEIIRVNFSLEISNRNPFGICGEIF